MKKEIVARVLYYTGISWICFFISRFFYGAHIRAVNYHSTPESLAGNFEKQLKWYSRWYTNTNLTDLSRFLQSGDWSKRKPGVLLSFDDGKRNNYDIAKPLLERYGFTGWFFIPAGWVIASVQEQREFQALDLPLLDAYPSDRVIVNEEELTNLTLNHIIGCHTYSHHRMNADDSPDTLYKEIVQSKEVLTKLCKVDSGIFCWVGGEEKHYTRQAALTIKDTGYTYSFTTNTYPILPDESPLKLERTNIEADNSLPLLVFQMSGLMDIFYRGKRKRLKSVFF
ncbi:MAG: polysaccharide deacetylase family protein [Chitinophagaceae bacterium]